MEVNVTIMSANQIGKKKETNSTFRLIKITIGSEWEKALLLRNSTKLCNKNKPEYVQKIFITLDLTSRKQHQNKVPKAELAKRNKDGNKYWIKNGKIVQRGN